MMFTFIAVLLWLGEWRMGSSEWKSAIRYSPLPIRLYTLVISNFGFWPLP